MGFNYINQETNDLINYRDDENILESSGSLFYKPLETEQMKELSKATLNTKFKMVNLSEINPLLPKEIMGDSNGKQIGFMNFNSEHKDIGIGFTGKFRRDSNKPDELSMYVGKITNVGDYTGFVAYRKLKDTAGLQDFYKFGNSNYTSKQRIVLGADGSNKGATSISNSGYEILQFARSFLKKSSNENTKEGKLLKSILENDYSAISENPFYSKSDSWSIKNDKLTSGSLETAIFDTSQIMDASILSSKMSAGERYTTSSFLDTNIFEKIKSSIKRNSTRNRSELYKAISENGSILEPQELKDIILNIERDKINNIFNVLNDDIENVLENKSSISGDVLYKNFNYDGDVLYKRKKLINSLKNKISNVKNISIDEITERDIKNFKFKVDELKHYINEIDDTSKNVETSYMKKLNIVLKSQLESALNVEFLDNILKKTLKTERHPVSKIIYGNAIRTFYDRYNLNINLYDEILNRRKNNYISEVDLEARKISIERNSEGDITNIFENSNQTIKTFSEGDKKLIWGYNKAKQKIGFKKFNSLSVEEKIKQTQIYLNKNKELYEKHNEKSILAKYDSYENFIEATSTATPGSLREMMTGTAISRTSDKILSKIDYKDNSMNMSLANLENINGEKQWVEFNLKFKDGFEKNDYIKLKQQDQQAVLKEMDLDIQLKIKRASELIEENDSIQRQIRSTIKLLDPSSPRYQENRNELLGYISFLKGHREKKKRYFETDNEGNSLNKINKDYKFKEGKKTYVDMYREVVNRLNETYNLDIKTKLTNNDSTFSETDLNEMIFNPKKNKELNNTVFNMLLNKDEIINTTGSAKQTGTIGGDSYLGALGSVLPGVGWNKITQRTYQAQDLLGESTMTVFKDGKERVVTKSELNAEILSRTGFTGVGLRRAYYKTEELVKESIEKIRISNNLRDMPYTRGKTYKTFAIGDVNTEIKAEGNINSFTASFQEGMTATKAMQLTTNAIRNKNIKINLDELNNDALGFTKNQVHELLANDKTRDFILSKVIDEKLYKTIEGKKRLEKFYSDINEAGVIKNLNGDIGSLKSAYVFLASKLDIKPKNIKLVNTEESKMKITSEIMKLLGDAEKTLGSYTLPYTIDGKINITNVKYTNKRLKMKPEAGFRLASHHYNSQDNSIELLLENIGSVDQGSKQQTTGAKFTVSEVYDFIKIKSKHGETFVDAIFNNKAEKRMQTGMEIHGALQTVVTNVYEDLGEAGIKTLKRHMNGLLKDIQTDIKVSKKFGVLIDESYLTKDSKGEPLTAEKFLELSKETTLNMNKIFTEKGKEIIDTVVKKYGASYYTASGELLTGQMSHYGVLAEMQKAYTKTYLTHKMPETPFLISKAELEGFGNEGKTKFGKGSMLLLKLPSERVNSNANKKKDGGLKVGREIKEMIRINGYTQLADYLDNKNKNLVNEYLGNVYTNLTNSEILNVMYDHNKDFNVKEMIKSVAESSPGGIVLDISKMKENDYLFDKEDTYLSHEKLLEKSSLGEAMKAKELGEVIDGKLTKAINVVLDDENVREYTKNINEKIKTTKTYFEETNDLEQNYKNDINDALETIASKSNLTKYEVKEINKKILKANTLINSEIKKLSLSKGNEESIEALETTQTMFRLFNKYSNSKYSLNQLQSVFKTGNILNTIELDYDVSEVDGTIVSSEAFTRLKSIARKSKEYSFKRKISNDFFKKSMDKESNLIEEQYEGLLNYLNGNKNKGEIEQFINLLTNLNLSKEETKSANIIKKINQHINQRNLHEVEVRNANKFISANINSLDLTNEELKNSINKIEERLKSANDDLSLEGKNIRDILVQEEVSNHIKGKAYNTIYGDDKLKGDKSFAEFFKEENRVINNVGVSLLDEYLKIPDEAKSIFKKRGKLVNSQKLKIKSSFTANPIEGSNLLNKFENLMFEGVTTKAELNKNLNEFGDFLGFKVINQRLFEGDGMNYLDELTDNKELGSFEDGLKKAREIFSKNLANISEITISSKDYQKSFRGKDFVYKDLYTGEDINSKGFVREMAFFARHPQQTVNHMGALQTITLDVKNQNLKNKFARASLTFLSNEKNQAGVITLGKKTMLFRRGDHDGDKVSQAYTDFITDENIKLSTLNNMMFEYQSKNKVFGVWDDVSGNYSKITGHIFDKNANLIDLEKVKNPIEYITEHLGMTAEQLSMRTKMLHNYNFAVEGRAYKELAKHYNSIYEIMTQLDDFSFDPKNRLSKDDIDRLEKIIKFSSDGKHHGVNINANFREEHDISHAITVGSKYARANIENSLSVVDMLRRGKTDISKFKKTIKGMDLIGATALFHILKGNKDDYETLLKKTHKEIDKFISRGQFDKFYSYKSSTGVFDELSGIRNTGKTHSYATKLRVTGVEVSKINVEKFMSKLELSNSRIINFEDMRESIRKQNYYSEASDIFFDNMIESAISAKHGLTLGGLEGSKLFINTMLSSSGKLLNDKMIKMFDEVFVNNNNEAMVEIADNLLEFNRGFRSFDKHLENIITTAESQGLNKELLLKSFDFDDDYFKELLRKDKVNIKKIDSYIEYKNMYLDELSNVENSLFDLVKGKRKWSPLDFEAYKGLHLFGELMIQNDPNSEYEVDAIKDIVGKYKNKEISIKELLGNYEFKKFKSQLYTTLGTSASISNIGNLREHIKTFNRVVQTNKISNELFDIASVKFGIDRNEIGDYFNSKLEIRKTKKQVPDGMEKIAERYANRLKNLTKKFEREVQVEPVSAYASAINRNVTDFTTSGKSGDVSLDILEEYRQNGVPSINDSLLSEGIENIEELRNKRISEIALHYSTNDASFQKFVLDESFSNINSEVKSGMIKQASAVAEEVILQNLRKKLRVLPISEIDSGKVVQVVPENNLNKLTSLQKEMEEMGTLKSFNGDFKTIDPEIFNSDKTFYFGRADLFFTKESTQEFMKLYEKNPNIFISEWVANTILKSFPKYAILIDNERNGELTEELILANLHLKEEINLKNAMKRVDRTFDPALASRIKVADFIDKNKEFLEMKKDKKLFGDFKIKLINNLEGILNDYSKIDKNLKTLYVDDYYLNLAHTFTSENKKYIKIDDILSDKKSMKKFKKYKDAIEKVLSEEKHWLNDNAIDEDIFKKVSTMELINKLGEVSDEYDLNTIMLNTAKAIKGTHIEDRVFEFGKYIKADNKLGLIAKTAIGLAGLLGVSTFIKKINSNLNIKNGTYVLGKTSENLDEQELMEQLHMGNNKKTPMGIAELIEGINIPEYISIIKNKYF